MSSPEVPQTNINTTSIRNLKEIVAAIFEKIKKSDKFIK